MQRRCPNLLQSHAYLSKKQDFSESDFHPVIRKGSYYRASDERRITRYFCKKCCLFFSSATFDPRYKQKRRDVNRAIFEYLCSGVSQRRLARNLRINPKTVVRKFRYLAHHSRLKHETWLKEQAASSIESIQFDDLETSEHTKCKPLSVALAVNKKTREILSFQVSKMPAKGHLAKVAIKKYGYRRDERSKGWNQLFKELSPILSVNGLIESDENPHYQKYLRRHLPKIRYETFKGARGAIGGQGELKKLRHDPLFSLNHTCAMLRANLNRLFRRTWCTTKNVQGLVDHLSIYVMFHNQELVLSGAGKGGS